MDDTQREVSCFGGVEQLELATRIGGGQDGCPHALDVLQLPLQKGIGHLGLGEVVDPGASATPRALGEFDQA